MNELKVKGPQPIEEDAKYERAHWLPFASGSKQEYLPCDVQAYFNSQEHEGGYKSTFRGRNLQGSELDLGEFKWYDVQI